MARAIWSGVLTSGLVPVPVELYPATEAHGPVFHQFEEGTSDRIRAGPSEHDGKWRHDLVPAGRAGARSRKGDVK